MTKHDAIEKLKEMGFTPNEIQELLAIYKAEGRGFEAEVKDEK